MPDSAAAVDLREVEAFLFLEARLLDEARYDDWLALYTGDATYWVPLERGQQNPSDTSSLIYDDRKLLEARVRQFSHPRRHAQTPASRTCHVVGCVEPLGTGADGRLAVRSKLIVVEFRAERQIIHAGSCEHRLVREGAGYKIAAKRVDLVNSEGELEGISVLL